MSDEFKALRDLAAEYGEPDSELVEWVDMEGRIWRMLDGRVSQLGKSPRMCNAKRVALKRGMAWQWPLAGKFKYDAQASPKVGETETERWQRERREALEVQRLKESLLRERSKAKPGKPFAGGRNDAVRDGTAVPIHGAKSRFSLERYADALPMCATPNTETRRVTLAMIAWHVEGRKTAKRNALREALTARGFKLSHD